MSLRDDINIPVIVVLGLTTGLIVAVAIVGTQAGYNYVTQIDLARNYATAEQRGLLHYGENVWRPQVAALNEPTKWVGMEKASVTLPLERAKALMVESKLKAAGDVKSAAEAQAAAEAKANAAQNAAQGAAPNAGSNAATRPAGN